MRIKFPFNIAQISDNEVEIELLGDEPIISFDVHHSIRDFVDDSAMAAIYEKAVEGVIRACIKISR